MVLIRLERIRICMKCQETDSTGRQLIYIQNIKKISKLIIHICRYFRTTQFVVWLFFMKLILISVSVSSHAQMFFGSRLFLLAFARNSSKLWKTSVNGLMARITYASEFWYFGICIVKYPNYQNCMLPTGQTTAWWLRSCSNERHSYESSWS